MAQGPPWPETFTPLSLLGEAFVKVGREHNDPQLEAAGLLLMDVSRTSDQREGNMQFHVGQKVAQSGEFGNEQQ